MEGGKAFVQKHSKFRLITENPWTVAVATKMYKIIIIKKQDPEFYVQSSKSFCV